jgi:peptidoglycan/LPS O-acetylase OafA/YrhL
MVFLYHAFAWSMGNSGWTGIARLVERITRPGWLGVDLFFVLSGFLITGVLLDAKGQPHYFKTFYARRALRILPAYYLLLLVLLLVYGRSGFSFVLVSGFYLSNLAPLFHVPVMYGPLWSLSVEEHFYLFWPWVTFGVSRRALGWICGCICSAEPLLRIAGFLAGSDTFSYSWFRIDALAWGGLLAVFVRSSYCSARRLIAVAGAAFSAASLLFWLGGAFGIATRTRLVGASLQATCCALLFFGLLSLVISNSGVQITSALRSGIAVWFGEISYSLYLVHLLIFTLWDYLIKAHPLLISAGLSPFATISLRAAAVFLLSLTVARLSYRLVESPFLRLKRFFEYRRLARA